MFGGDVGELVVVGDVEGGVVEVGGEFGGEVEVEEFEFGELGEFVEVVLNGGYKGWEVVVEVFEGLGDGDFGVFVDGVGRSWVVGGDCGDG